MSFSRREALKGGAGMGVYGAMLALGMISPGTAQAQAAMQAAFQAKGIPDTLKALGAAGATESADISIVSP
ncbi:MAG: thiosulfate oxidation carrier protein SoxY, partial [Burkholderiales bacterium]